MRTDLELLRAALAGRYDLTAEIGRGGMARVYRAEDLRHGRPVAVKVLRRDVAGQVGTARFLQEIRIESGLQHPNILPVLDSGEADGLPYYIMPFIEGASLADRLATVRQLPVDEAVRVAAQVGAALEHAHARGVIHRDIKPENILLSGGQALVADFGIARAMQRAGGGAVTSSGMVLGTPAYMSPEQAFGEATIDGRSDQYALACVLHQMLVGEPPFAGPTAQAVLARHALERPPSIPIVRPGIPEHIVAAIERGMSKAPADRFPDVAAFVAALQDPSWYRAPAPARRRRWGVAVGLLAAGALAWLALRPPPPPLDPHRVVVHPLEERGLTAADQGAGHDVALMITAALEHTEPLRGYDGSLALPASLRARYALDGVVRQDADSTMVVLRLHDLEGDSLVAQQTAAGATAGVRPYQLGLQALRPLLPRILDPGRAVDLAPLADRRVSAVALWIQGERAYRQGRFAEALGFYQRAVAEDSALALAAVKGAQAASWTNRLGEAGMLAALALRDESRLPRRYARFARGVAGYVSGQADSALAALEEVRGDSPDWGEAHMAAGEVAYHLLPLRPLPDSFAERAFARALAADPGFLPPAVHLADIALRRGDLRQADRYIRLLAASPPDSMIARQLGVMRRCVAGELDAGEWRDAAAQGAEAVLRAARALSAGGAQPGCAEAGFRAVLAAGAPAFHWGAFLGLRGILAAQGRRDEVVALVDSMAAAGTAVARSTYVLDALAGLEVKAEARDLAEYLQATFGDSLQRLGRTASGTRSRWLLGSWWLAEGHPGPVAALVDAARWLADSLSSRAAAAYGAGLAAQLTLARGDTAAALAGFRALAPTAPRDTLQWDLGESLPVERLRWAELALATGDPAEALRVASGFDHPEPIIYLGFLPASLDLRRRAAQALGRPDLERSFRARLDRLGAGTSPPTGGRQ